MERRLPLFLLVLALLALLTTVALAQGDYVLTRSVIAGGGGTSSGGTYDLWGTIGQPVVGTGSGGRYILTSGFWGRLGFFFEVYLPLALKNFP